MMLHELWDESRDDVKGVEAGCTTQEHYFGYLVWQAAIQTYEQVLSDPENQPSQFGTVPLEWYENLENRLERVRFKVGEVIDSLDGSYEKHAIRKALQEAIE